MSHYACTGDKFVVIRKVHVELPVVWNVHVHVLYVCSCS
jgi:hypothetical protein